MDNTITAVVLAGGTMDRELRTYIGKYLPSRAHIQLGNYLVIQYVLWALKRAPVDKIILVGNDFDNLTIPADSIIPDQGSLLDNIKAAQAVTDTNYTLLVTADLPYLRSCDVRDFIQGGLTLDADVCCGLVPMAICKRDHPNIKRTGVRLNVDGNVQAVTNTNLDRLCDVVPSLYKHRKNPFKLAMLFGLKTAVALLTVKLKLRSLEERASEILSVSCRGLVLDCSSLATDLDTLEHYKAMKRNPPNMDLTPYREGSRARRS